VRNSGFAYSTTDTETIAAYRQAKAGHSTFAARLRADVEALGAGPRVYLRSGAFGSPNTITGLEPKGDTIPEGWRIVRGNLEPRRGKPGEQARQWLAAHQPVDTRHVLAQRGLPRDVWVPNPKVGNYRVVAPEIFEHKGVLWALYEAEPGSGEIAFDDAKCTWTPRKLSEFHTAFEAFEEADDPEADQDNADTRPSPSGGES
jgi:hypothetical protein